MLQSSANMRFIFIIAVVVIAFDECLSVGPDLKAKQRLLHDLRIGLDRPPPPKRRDRTLIEMSLGVRSLDLDFATGVFRTDGWMSLKWNDERYAWNPDDYDGLESLTLPFSRLWAPEVILHNSVEERFVYRQVGVVKSTGEIVYMISVHTKSVCEPDYDVFPFGLQVCKLEFGSWVNEHYSVEYRLKEDNATVIMDDFSSPAGWKVSKRHQSNQCISILLIYLGGDGERPIGVEAIPAVRGAA